MRVLVFLASGIFFNESLGFFGLRHFVSQWCALSSYGPILGLGIVENGGRSAFFHMNLSFI